MPPKKTTIVGFVLTPLDLKKGENTLLGVFFPAEGPQGKNTFGKIIQRHM
jgi:hypothetical protein